MPDAPRVWAATRLGLVRPTNEDRWRVGAHRPDGGDIDWSGAFPGEHPWALVADGMGGHGAGEVASAVALDALDGLLRTCGTSDLNSAIWQANRAVFDAMPGPSGRQAMGTTVAGLCRDGQRLALFNVGDSRIYRLRRSRLELLSVDHTAARRGGLRSHALTQSLGGTSVPIPIRPHLAFEAPVPGDVFLLCTDGLTDMLRDGQLQSALEARSVNPAARLAEAAVEAGGRDNVTAVVIAF